MTEFFVFSDTPKNELWWSLVIRAIWVYNVDTKYERRYENEKDNDFYNANFNVDRNDWLFPDCRFKYSRNAVYGNDRRIHG